MKDSNTPGWEIEKSSSRELYIHEKCVFCATVKFYDKFWGKSKNSYYLDQSSWIEIYQINRNENIFVFEGSLGRRTGYLQYKLRLDTGNTGTGPIVKSVGMSLK